MQAEVIAIGDELTSGQRLDTNSPWLALRLGEIGVRVTFHTTVGDDLDANVRVFREALQRADIIVASGGLGPTADDLTRQALADAVGVSLVQDDAALAHIRSLFARRKREMPAANVVQAQFPAGSRVIPNPNGTAPGIDLTALREGRSPARVFCLPGVPAEMKEMWTASVAPVITRMLPEPRIIRHRRIKCFGVGESDLEAMLPDLIARDREPLVGITVSQATITLRVTASGRTPDECDAIMQPTLDTIHACLGDLIFGSEDDELQHAVLRLLRQQGARLVTIECGTGGLLASWLSDVPDAGDVYLGGEVTASHRDISEDQLVELLNRRSSPEAGCALAVGPLPKPGSTQSEVLLVAIVRDRTVKVRTPYLGHPDILKARVAKSALNLLRLTLLEVAQVHL